MDAVNLESENELKSPKKGNAQGIVLESELDRFEGLVYSISPKRHLKKGDVIVAGEKRGKIKTLIDSSGAQVKEAGPSTPVEVLGLKIVFQLVSSFL